MSRSAPALVIQLYTEDSRDTTRGCATLQEVVLGLLVHIRPDLKTNHVAMRPVHEAPERRVSGAYWKAKPQVSGPGAQDRRTLLIQDIVTALRRGHIVIFHVDGDDRWLVDGQHAEVWRHLARLCSDLKRSVFDPSLGRSPLSKEVALEHVFIPAVPFYSMESWAYANTGLLRALLDGSDPNYASDLGFIEQWEADPGQRDDTLRIKDETLRVRDEMNEQLVKRSRGFPCAELVALGKSYAATRHRLAESPQIQRGLAEAAARPY